MHLPSIPEILLPAPPCGFMESLHHCNGILCNIAHFGAVQVSNDLCSCEVPSLTTCLPSQSGLTALWDACLKAQSWHLLAWSQGWGSFLFAGTRAQTQGLMLARQVFYQLSPSATALFFFVCVCVLFIFKIGSHQLFTWAGFES
jgi:hypothetical protein